MRPHCILAACIASSVCSGCAGDNASSAISGATPLAASAPAISSPLKATASAGTAVLSGTKAPTPTGPRLTYTAVEIEQPYVALTFDDGPHSTLTPKLLDILKARGVKATFFVLGQCVANSPEVLKRTIAEGHEVGSHTWSHPLLTKLSDAAVRSQLNRTREIVKKVGGYEVRQFRPPYGGLSNRQRNWIHEEFGYANILWAVDPLDWKNRNAELVTRRILEGAHRGAIILAHDIHASTIAAMPATIDGLLARGFKFATVSELIAMEKAAQSATSVAQAGAAPSLSADASR